VHVVELRTDRGATLRCEVANTFWRRFRGLMLRSGLAPAAGMLFAPCGSIHTAFMRFPIDVVFIARDGTILRTAEHVQPWRFRAARRRTRFVLELAAGEAAVHGLMPGRQVQLGREGDLRGSQRLEAVSVALAALVCVLSVARFDSTLAVGEAAFFGCVLVLLAAIDFERHVLPNRIVLPAAVVLAVVEVAADPGAGWRRLLWGVGAFGVLLGFALVYPPGLGMGDVKLALLLGIGLGASVVSAFLLGTFAAALVAAALLVRHRSQARKLPIPLGSFLALASLVLLFTNGPR
jgi:uncharacterized membrane protein (UPF0127 family)/Flp pilus assembly protein protease CpaA